MTIPPYQLVADALHCDPATLTESSRLNHHPDWDSMGHLNVMMALEQQYGVEIDDQSIERFASMAAIVARHAELTGDKT